MLLNWVFFQRVQTPDAKRLAIVFFGPEVFIVCKDNSTVPYLEALTPLKQHVQLVNWKRMLWQPLFCVDVHTHLILSLWFGGSENNFKRTD